MNKRSAARELAFLAIGQISVNTDITPNKLIFSATETLKDIALKELKKVQKDLKVLGEYFFNEKLNQETKNFPFNMNKMQDNVANLELASFAIKEALEINNLINNEEESYSYACKLIDHYRNNKTIINELISEVLEKRKLINEDKKGWTLNRIMSTDRTILKISLAELLFEKEVPFVVIIDEAVKLSRKYGGDESPKFVNGVLADLAKTLAKKENNENLIELSEPLVNTD